MRLHQIKSSLYSPYYALSGLHTEAVTVNVTVASAVTTTLGCSHTKMWAGGDGTLVIFLVFPSLRCYLNVMTEGKKTEFELCEWSNCSTSVLVVA